MDSESHEDDDLVSEVAAIRNQLEALLLMADECAQPMLAIKLDEALQIARSLEVQLKAGQ